MQRLRKWTQVNLFTEKYNNTTRSRSRDITVWIYIVKFEHALPLNFSVEEQITLVDLHSAGTSVISS